MNKESFSSPDLAANNGLLCEFTRADMSPLSAAKLGELNACFSTIRRIGRNEACLHATFSRACGIHILRIRSHMKEGNMDI